MSAPSNTGLSSIDPSLLGPSTPAINESLLPASIRNGTPAAKQAYNEALGFEQMLVNELTQQLAATASGSTDGSDDGLGGDGSSDDGSTTDSASGLLGSDPSSSIYAQLLPDALTSSLMASGGTGMALEIAKALDPSIGTATAAAANATTPAANTTSPTASIPSSGGAAIAPAPAGTASTGTPSTGTPSTGTPSTGAPSTGLPTGGAAIAPPTGANATSSGTGDDSSSGTDGADAAEPED
jgi:Rod binding domain-containing protein